MSLIDKEACVHAIDSMKKQCYDEAIGLIVELRNIFQFQELFKPLGEYTPNIGWI
jgi:hypothetical protein